MRESRKLQLIILMVLVCLVGTLSIAYAVLSTTLQINGNAEVSSASWDIYLDNPQVVGGSVTVGIPTITDKTTATFSTTLSKPGDYYMFTVDVVNNGTIDAMIDGIIKSPTLTEAQAKYFSYVVEYQNGESITTKQLVAKKSFVRLKVKVEFRKDITASDLPTQSETLSLSFKVNYVQSDDSGENVTIDNNGKLIKVVSGDLNTVGSEICIGQECFYVISSDEDSVTMLAKYNLYVGNKYDAINGVVPLENPTGVQAQKAIGYFVGISELNPVIGNVVFSTINYWSSMVSSYPAYVYDSNSNLYKYVENYKKYLQELGVIVESSRLIKYEELIELGCLLEDVGCTYSSYPWIYSTSYWTGSVSNSSRNFDVVKGGRFGDTPYYDNNDFGVRPVIEISVSNF